MKDQEWNINIGHEAITIRLVYTISLPRDIPVETVGRIISEDFRTNEVVKVNYRVMFLQLIVPFFAKVLMLEFFTIYNNKTGNMNYSMKGSASFNLMDLSYMPKNRVLSLITVVITSKGLETDTAPFI